MKFHLFLLISILFAAGCSQDAVRPDILDARQVLRSAVIRAFPYKYEISAEELSGTLIPADYQYLSKAIPETFMAYLKPIMIEKAFVPYDGSGFNPTPEVMTILSSNTNIFSNYLVPVMTVNTQLLTVTSTNTNYTAVPDRRRAGIVWLVQAGQATNSPGSYAVRSELLGVKDPVPLATNTYQLPAILSNAPLSVTGSNSVTNTNSPAFLFETNMQFTNVSLSAVVSVAGAVTQYLVISREPTNALLLYSETNTLPDSNWNRLLAVEYPELTNTFSFLPITVDTTILSNKSTNTSRYGFRLSGSYKVIDRKEGPADVEIILRLTPQNGITNRQELKMTIREDLIPGEISSWLRPVRSYALNRPSGDLYVVSEAGNTSVYMDGTFIGRTPLFYPVVSPGYHVLMTSGENQETRTFAVSIESNITNLVQVPGKAVDRTGILTVDSKPTNAWVFLDSVYIGSTPLTLSNVTTGMEHRLKVQTAGSNLYPWHASFTINSPGSVVSYNVTLPSYEGFSPADKQLARFSSYTAWGLTLGMLGFNIYTHSMREYYLDMFIANPSITDYSSMANTYTSWSQTSFYGFIVGALISSLCTTWALSTEDLFLGYRGPFQNSSPYVPLIRAAF